MSLTCFQTYDIRGQINIDIDESIAYRIGRAVAQHFSAKSVIVGFDARESSFSFASAVARGVKDSGSNVLDIGLAGTEETNNQKIKYRIATKKCARDKDYRNLAKTNFFNRNISLNFIK